MVQRSYYIDWIRVISVFLLLVYHTAIGFQPWGFLIGFITNFEFMIWLWKPMAMVNVWRIPILFYVAGMGVYFTLKNMNYIQLLTERLYRLGLPLFFGSFIIVPIHFFILHYTNFGKYVYMPGIGHLWFLGNILSYIVLLGPILLIIEKRSEKKTALTFKKYMATPFSIVIIILLFVLEVEFVNPPVYEMYAFTLHGLILGMLAFIMGFLFMYSGSPFWEMLNRYKYIFLVIAILLFVLRSIKMPIQSPNYLLAIESNSWIFSLFAFANKYLNRNSVLLTYCKEAAYPVYIIHMTFLYLGSIMVFPLHIGALVKFLLLLSFTFIGSLFFYEIVIKRFNVIRPFFGLKKDNLI